MALDHVQPRRKPIAGGNENIASWRRDKQIGDPLGDVSHAFLPWVYPFIAANGVGFPVKTDRFRLPRGRRRQVVDKPGWVTVGHNIGNPANYPVWNEV